MNMVVALPASKRRRLNPPEQDDRTATKTFYDNAAQWDLEAAYAQRSKKRSKDKRDDRLPIKTKDGVVQQVKREAEALAADEDVDGSDLDSMLDEDDVRRPVEQEAQKPVKVQVLEAQEELARIASMLSEDPEEHIAQLKGLSKVADSPIPAIKKLGMAAQVAVFKDIIPGYRIRPVSEDELKAKLSKDVKKLRTFEQTLVACYRDFVTGLGRMIKASSKRDGAADNGMGSAAVACACTLLDAVPHFNFRSELLNAIVGKVSSRSVNADYIKCRTTLEALFANDEEGNTSLEAVTLLTKMMKAKDYNIHESLLDTFLHLRLLSEYSFRASTTSVDKAAADDDDSAQSRVKNGKKTREFRTKRRRKELKEQRAIEAEMKEADATVSYEERDRNQSEMLKLVFVAYFRILKARKPRLMGAVLEGLARYAHLINQDFFGDILESLRDLIVTNQHTAEEDADAEAEDASQPEPSSGSGTAVPVADRDFVREQLLCVVTAFSLLQGQDVHKSASALHLDLSFFTQQLYTAVLPLSLDCGIETSASKRRVEDNSGRDTSTDEQNGKKKKKVNAQTPALLLIRSLSALLLPPQSTRAVPPTLVAAFVKRLLTAALQLPEKSATAVLALVREVVRVHGDRVQALWRTEERRGDGIFDPEREEVESANPFAATVWEGEMLKMHYCPAVREGAAALELAVKKSGKT